MPKPCADVNKPRVLIVLLNWNGHSKTAACIASLRQMDFHDYRILVIDNGSTDGSGEALSAIEGIELIRNEENLGFTGGSNRGLREAEECGAEYVWLLNNDTEVAPDCLRRLVATADANPQAALLSPVLYDSAERERIQHAGSRYRLAPPSIDEAADLRTAQAWQAEDARRVVLWGTALLVRTAALPQIGLLDERLFAYSEDTEYSIRCGEAGFEKLTVTDARVWHDWNDGLRSPYYYYYTVRNGLLIWRRHLPALAYLRVLHWTLARMRSVLADLDDHPQHREACLAGFWDGLRQHGGGYDNRGTMPALLKPLLLRRQHA